MLYDVEGIHTIVFENNFNLKLKMDAKQLTDQLFYTELGQWNNFLAQNTVFRI